MAALPEFHAPLSLSPAEQRKYGADISFLGAGYPNRRVAFRLLAHRNFKIWGTEWEDEPLLARNLQNGGARIAPEECVKIYNATRINLNLHSSVQCRDLVPGGDFVNPRTFELASIGAFQLVDRRTLMPELFAEDALATFSDVPDLLEKIDYFMDRPEERAAYAARARTRAVEEHTYQHRMRTLVDFVRRVKTDWPRKRVVGDFPPDMPETMRREVTVLLERLGLPADASFDDCIVRLRQQTGVLTGLETSLLFLDEWRKQYAGKK